MKGIIKVREYLTEEYKKKNAFTGVILVNPYTAVDGYINISLNKVTDFEKYTREFKIPFTITSETGDTHIIWCNCSPTGNCQLASITHAFKLASFENGASMLKTMVNTAGKHLALCDIEQRYSSEFEALFENKKAIVFKNDYTSTNYSSMCVYLINTQYI